MLLRMILLLVATLLLACTPQSPPPETGVPAHAVVPLPAGNKLRDLVGRLRLTNPERSQLMQMASGSDLSSRAQALELLLDSQEALHIPVEARGVLLVDVAAGEVVLTDSVGISTSGAVVHYPLPDLSQRPLVSRVGLATVPVASVERAVRQFEQIAGGAMSSLISEGICIYAVTASRVIRLSWFRGESVPQAVSDLSEDLSAWRLREAQEAHSALANAESGDVSVLFQEWTNGYLAVQCDLATGRCVMASVDQETRSFTLDAGQLDELRGCAHRILTGPHPPAVTDWGEAPAGGGSRLSLFKNDLEAVLTLENTTRYGDASMGDIGRLLRGSAGSR